MLEDPSVEWYRSDEETVVREVCVCGEKSDVFQCSSNEKRVTFSSGSDAMRRERKVLKLVNISSCYSH